MRSPRRPPRLADAAAWNRDAAAETARDLGAPELTRLEMGAGKMAVVTDL